jgi:hypothetical protein
MYRRHESNFVAPLPEPKRIEIVEGDTALPVSPTPVLLPKAGYRDRAEGFTLATAPLAASVGLVVALVAIVGWQVPIASLITLLLALGGFCAVWLVAYLAYVFVSPDGALFAHTFWTWRYLKAEQRERHARLRRLTDRE